MHRTLIGSVPGGHGVDLAITSYVDDWARVFCDFKKQGHQELFRERLNAIEQLNVVLRERGYLQNAEQVWCPCCEGLVLIMKHGTDWPCNTTRSSQSFGPLSRQPLELVWVGQ